MGPFWKSGFVVPQEAVNLFLDSIETDAESITAFEIDGGGNGEGGLWRVEMLHRDRPAKAALATLIQPLVAKAGLGATPIEIDEVADTDWVRRVQAEMPPRTVGRFWIHGSHVDEAPPAGAVPIRLDAGLAFGSGEHETTRGCLEAIDLIARRRRFRKVLDMGCGAGLLAIAAAKAWPARVLAVDNDPVAVEVTAENASRNGVGGQVQALVSDGYAHTAIRARGPFDLVLSNILADPLCLMAGALGRSLARDGCAVLSGLLDRQADRVIASHRVHGVHPRRRIEIGPWTTLVMSRKKT